MSSRFAWEAVAVCITALASGEGEVTNHDYEGYPTIVPYAFLQVRHRSAYFQRSLTKTVKMAALRRPV
jgi:hypothetical protein